jgi:serine/threonine protein kinase
VVLHGERLDRPTYSVIQTISEGNTALCYKAWHEIFKEYIVQKTVSLLGLDDALAYDEPFLLNQLRHDRLVEVREAQWDPEWCEVRAITFTMPYYPGGSLTSALLDGHRFSIGEAIGIACHVLDALHYLHVEKRLLHRDVKPGNIFLDDSRTLGFLGDLGSAVPMNERGTAEVRGGTLLYRPPDLYAEPYSATSDIYGVGMILLELVNGPLPYSKINQDDVIQRLSSGKPPLPVRLLKPAPHVPGQLSRAIGQFIDPNPRRRPRSASTAQRVLERIPHMDWRLVNEAPRTWVGSKPAAARKSRRIYEVKAEDIETGRYAGKIELTARWRAESVAHWRGMPSARVRIGEDDDAAIRAFFKSVETA